MIYGPNDEERWIADQDRQAQACDCFRVPHAFYCVTISPPVVPGYWDTADGKADLADQARMDRQGR